MIDVDIAGTKVRELNQRLHALPKDTNERAWRVLNPMGAHSIAAGLYLGYLLRRIGLMAYTLAIVSILVFAITQISHFLLEHFSLAVDGEVIAVGTGEDQGGGIVAARMVRAREALGTVKLA